jgi:hypothetical protein
VDIYCEKHRLDQEAWILAIKYGLPDIFYVSVAISLKQGVACMFYRRNAVPHIETTREEKKISYCKIQFKIKN